KPEPHLETGAAAAAAGAQGFDGRTDLRQQVLRQRYAPAAVGRLLDAAGERDHDRERSPLGMNRYGDFLRSRRPLLHHLADRAWIVEAAHLGDERGERALDRHASVAHARRARFEANL